MGDNDRVMVFVDGGNLYRSLKRQGTTRVDIVGMIDRLCGEGRRLIRAYYYTPVPMATGRELEERAWQQIEAHMRFLAVLERSPHVTVRKGRAVMKEDGGWMGGEGIGAMIATDMLSLAYQNKYDVAVLVSTEDDYACIVEEVLSFGKSVENASFSTVRSSRLSSICDKFIDLEEIVDGCWLDDGRHAKIMGRGSGDERFAWEDDNAEDLGSVLRKGEEGLKRWSLKRR